MRALLYLKSTGTVLGGAMASLEADLLVHETPEIGVLLSDLDWREAEVDLSNPEAPVAIPRIS